MFRLHPEPLRGLGILRTSILDTLLNHQVGGCSRLHGEASGGDELFEDLSELSIDLVVKLLLNHDGVNNMRVLALEMFKEEFLKLADL